MSSWEICQVKYVSYLLYSESIARRLKANKLRNILSLYYFENLNSYLGSLKFNGKFFSPSLFTTIEPLDNITCQDTNVGFQTTNHYYQMIFF